MTSSDKIKIGSMLKFGETGEIYEITDFYFSIEENSGQYQAFVEMKKNNNDAAELYAVWMILEMIQMGHLYRPDSKFSEEYYQTIVKPRLDKLRS